MYIYIIYIYIYITIITVALDSDLHTYRRMGVFLCHGVGIPRCFFDRGEEEGHQCSNRWVSRLGCVCLTNCA